MNNRSKIKFASKFAMRTIRVAAKPRSRRAMLAQAAVTLGRQSLDAEQKKLNLGASTSTLVLQNESVLATNESNLVSAMACL